ncbi:MAG: NAD-binding protein [Tissierellales bacterium]|nr:NAD-binding protein [Tissierellales bacterium]
MNKSNLKVEGDFGIRDHVIICNWSSKADIIVRQLHDESVHDKHPIIVITNSPQDIPKTTDPAYRGLLMISGDPANKEILKRADVGHSKSVIVLADENDLENSDSKSILIVLAVESINPNVHIIVEIVKSNSVMFFQYTHVNEIVCLEQLAEKLLAQSALTPGLSQVYMDLLTQSAETNEIYQENIPESLIGMSYRDVEATIIQIDEKDIILIGFSTVIEKLVNGVTAVNGKGNIIYERKIVINPKSSTNDKYSKNYKFQKGDTIFLISYEKPEIEQYFIKQ